MQYGEPIQFERVAHPTSEQQQAVADQIFGEIKRLYAGLDEHGRKGMAQRMREQRRAERRASRTATA